MFVFIFGFHLALSSPLALPRLLAVLFCLVVFAHCFDYFERVFRLSLFIIPLFFLLLFLFWFYFFFFALQMRDRVDVCGGQGGGEAKKKNRYLDMSDTEKKGTHTQLEATERRQERVATASVVMGH